MNRHNTAWCLGAAAICLAFMLPVSFSSMAPYDDESYVMMTLSTFFEGERLYEETYTQYGPAYYMLQAPVHQWIGVPITHDVVRLKTIACWMLIAVFCGIVVSRMSRSIPAGLTAGLLAVLHLENLGLEPAHPQEIAALLAIGCVMLTGSKRTWPLFLAGVCAALAALVKLNVGAISAVACLFAVSFVPLGSRNRERVLRGFASLLVAGLAAMVALSIAKLAIERDHLERLLWPAITMVGVLLTLWFAYTKNPTAPKSKPDSETDPRPAPRLPRGFVAIATGGLIGSAIVVAWAIAHGNSIHELLHGIVLQHSFMTRLFYLPMAVHPLGGLFALVAGGLWVARLVVRKDVAKIEQCERGLVFTALAALGVCVILIGIDCWRPLAHGLFHRGAAHFLATAGPMLAPILLIRGSNPFRLTLAMHGCLSPLMAFPVPGTQVALGTLFVLIGLVVIAGDECRVLKTDHFFVTSFQRLPAAVAVVMLFAAVMAGSRWASNESLDQPGCRWVRLEPARAAKEKAIAQCIRNLDTDRLAFDAQNHNRFFFWTGKSPLTAITPTFWPKMLNEQQRDRIVAAIRDTDSVCVIKLQRDAIDLRELAPRIATELFENWRPMEEIGGWQIGLTEKRIPASIVRGNRE